jgi:hypothetical protein
MIVTPFSSKLLVKDYELPDQWTDELVMTLQLLATQPGQYCALHQSLQDVGIRDIYRHDTQKSSKPYIIHEQTAKEFKVIKHLREIFINGFLEINKEYGYQYSDAYLREVFAGDSGNFAVLTKGQRVGPHNHPSIAFAIFYLNDIDNDSDGGELILHDPSFHRNHHFHPKKEIRIQTKKNRLIVGPADIWHEVTSYSGSKNRICAVIDLKR